jgi:hypothetical protein
VKTESQGTTRGDTDRDNVVHLPARDWLGPREDLVPVGPAKHADSPPAPDDFWGEDSASLQDALRAPAAPEVVHEGASSARGNETTVSARRRPQLAVFAWRRWLAVGAVAAAVGVVALVVGGIGGSRAPARAVTTKTELADSTKSAHKASAAGARRASHPRQRARVHRSVRRTSARRHVVAVTGAPSTGATTPAAATSDSGASTESRDLASAPATDDTTSDRDSSTGHPTGPGAPFAPGYIP